jgi:hypothetical protein
MEKEQLKQKLAEKELELKKLVESGDAAIKVIESQWEFQRKKNIVERQDIQEEIDELRELIDNTDDAPTEILTSPAKPFANPSVDENPPEPKVKPVGMFGRIKRVEDEDESEEDESEEDAEENDYDYDDSGDDDDGGNPLEFL